MMVAEPVLAVDAHRPLLHVMFSPSSAGSLRQALTRQGRSDQVVCLFDDYSFGPLVADDETRIAWVRDDLRCDDWDDVVAATGPFLESSCSPAVLPVAWFSRRDARSYAGLIWWLSKIGAVPCRIIDVSDLTVATLLAKSSTITPIVSPAVLTADELSYLFDYGVRLDDIARQHYHALWTILAREDAPLRIVDDRGKLVSAPMTQFDATLLALATTSWQRMASIIGKAMTCFFDQNISQVGDLVLYARVCALAEEGSLEWCGDLKSMHSCQLRLPAPAD